MSCRIVCPTLMTYYPGSTISGHVVCTFLTEMEIRGVRVKLRGKEHSDHAERKLYTDSASQKVKYKDLVSMGGNRFLEIIATVIGEGTMAQGQYEYPFTFTLPLQTPSSYDGKYGYVKYHIKANVDIPFAYDFTDKLEFDVSSVIDFNMIRAELQLNPISYQEEKTLSCLCWASGPITMDVHLPKKAFVLGEVDRITIDITNMADKAIERIAIVLTNTVNTISNRKRSINRSYHDVLFTGNDSGVGAKMQRSYAFDLQIPTTAVVHNFFGCRLFSQRFTLTIVAILPDFHRNLKFETEVKLGHIPIGGILEDHNSSPSTTIIGATAPPEVSTPPEAIMTDRGDHENGSLLPPSYVEATGGLSAYRSAV
ncbi:hypothetical protein JTB14_031684 [Gonioctena quinquepunctata]|nr:hypothetical protein JTB14_031684 [Gonioctena quinquepunctata]